MDTLKLLSETAAMLERVDKAQQPALHAALRLEYFRLVRIRAERRELDERPCLRIWSDAS